MVVRVSRRASPQADARKALTLVADGRTVTFTGDHRHLRRVRHLLADHDVVTVLGDDWHGVRTLVVLPPGGAGWGSDRI